MWPLWARIPSEDLDTDDDHDDHDDQDDHDDHDGAGDDEDVIDNHDGHLRAGKHLYQGESFSRGGGILGISFMSWLISL